MKTDARVVVIGGGIAGLSTLYHLTLEGWNDVVLVERDELTSGTTWHSAAQCPNVAPNQLLIALRRYNIKLYKELADDPDYPINYHYAVGGLRLVTDQSQLDACNHIISVAKGVGVDFDLIGAAEAKLKNPLIETSDLLAALWDPLDGDIDPAQLCQALARRSRRAGAEIYRMNPVISLSRRAGAWVIQTRNGDIRCEHVVNASGYRVNEVGAMLGIEYPVISLEHMYFITESISELTSREARVAMVRCPRDTFYMRQEKDSLLVGVYEHDCKLFGWNGIDPDFVNALCPNDIDRCLPKLENIFSRVPILREVGIKSIVNGPITYSSDAGPLIGKLPGHKNLWSMNGIRVGIGEGGGYGKMLAQLIAHGETEFDTWQFDPRRITHYANRKYTALKAIEDYQNEFRWLMPHEHRSAGRPAKTTPLYAVLKQRGASFGVVNGWERVTFFGPTSDFVEDHTYRFPNWHDFVRREVTALSHRVGIAEISGFNRIEIRGDGALEWLDRLTCSNLPHEDGRVALAYFLTNKGNVQCEGVIGIHNSGLLWYISAAAAELHDLEWLQERVPVGADISIKNLVNDMTALVVAGPRSRAFLEAASPDTDFSKEAFPPLSLRRCYIGYIEATVLAVSYSGEVAFELHIPSNQLYAAYLHLVETGESFGLSSFGTYAIDSMRIEKGYGQWKADFITEYNPLESGLRRFVNFEKEFVGKAGLLEQKRRGMRRKRVLIAIGSEDGPAQPGDSIFQDRKAVGTVTSAAYGYRTAKNLAMAYIDPLSVDENAALTATILGREVSVSLIASPSLQYD